MRVSYDGGLRTLQVDPGDLLRPGRVVELLLLPGIVDLDGLPLETRPGKNPGAATDVLRFQVAGGGLLSGAAEAAAGPPGGPATPGEARAGGRGPGRRCRGGTSCPSNWIRPIAS